MLVNKFRVFFRRVVYCTILVDARCRTVHSTVVGRVSYRTVLCTVFFTLVPVPWYPGGCNFLFYLKAGFWPAVLVLCILEVFSY